MQRRRRTPGFRIADSEIEEYFALMQDGVPAYEAVNAMPENLPAPRYPRDSGYRPSAQENRYGAWYCKVSVKGAPQGKLAGRKIVIKDNVSLRASHGCRYVDLEGYVPSVDATIVTRILDAGGKSLARPSAKISLSRRQPHQCYRPGTKSAQADTRRAVLRPEARRWSQRAK